MDMSNIKYFAHLNTTYDLEELGCTVEELAAALEIPISEMEMEVINGDTLAVSHKAGTKGSNFTEFLAFLQPKEALAEDDVDPQEAIKAKLAALKKKDVEDAPAAAPPKRQKVRLVDGELVAVEGAATVDEADEVQDPTVYHLVRLTDDEVRTIIQAVRLLGDKLAE